MSSPGSETLCTRSSRAPQAYTAASVSIAGVARAADRQYPVGAVAATRSAPATCKKKPRTGDRCGAVTSRVTGELVILSGVGDQKYTRIPPATVRPGSGA